MSPAALLGSTALEHQQYYPKPGWVEHDAEEIYQNTLAAVRQLLTDRIRSSRMICCA
jgi:glycerol kinase